MQKNIVSMVKDIFLNDIALLIYSLFISFITFTVPMDVVDNACLRLTDCKVVWDLYSIGSFVAAPVIGTISFVLYKYLKHCIEDSQRPLPRRLLLSPYLFIIIGTWILWIFYLLKSTNAEITTLIGKIISG